MGHTDKSTGYANKQVGQKTEPAGLRSTEKGNYPGMIELVICTLGEAGIPGRRKSICALVWDSEIGSWV